MRIDVHSHYYSEPVAEALGRGGANRPYAYHPPLSSRLDEMDAVGVDKQLLSLGALMPYVADRGKAVDAARALNDLYRAAMDEHPGRFGAFGALPLPHVGASVAEIARCLDELAFDGIALGSGADGSPIDDERFDGMWEELDRRAAVVYLHPGIHNQCVLCNGLQHSPFVLNSSFGSPAETGRCVVRLVLSGVTARYPNIRFLVANFGGALPNAWPHVLHGAARTKLPDLVEPIRRMWFDTGTLTEPQLMAVKASFGEDRLVLGSDTPYGKLAETVGLIRTTAQLTPAAAELILERADAELFA